MGNIGSQGGGPGTRSGVPQPKLKTKGDPYFEKANHVSLELHLEEERERARGIHQSERAWRKKFVLDQKLHPDEPVYVEAAHRQLNPIRKLYRYPWDWIYTKYLRPNMSYKAALIVRMSVPKLIMLYMFGCYVHYHFKYNNRRWNHAWGAFKEPLQVPIYRRAEIEAEHPGLYDAAFKVPKNKKEWADFGYSKRVAHLDVGPPSRPW